MESGKASCEFKGLEYREQKESWRGNRLVSISGAMKAPGGLEHRAGTHLCHLESNHAKAGEPE